MKEIRSLGMEIFKLLQRCKLTNSLKLDAHFYAFDMCTIDNFLTLTALISATFCVQ